MFIFQGNDILALSILHIALFFSVTGLIILQSVQLSSFQSLSCVQLFATPWIAACQASLSITNSQSSPKFMCIKSVMPSSHLILCHPLLLLPPIPPSIRVFSNKSTLCMRWPKYWSSALASVFPLNTQDWSPLGWTGWISCSPRDPQESSPTPQFKSIKSSVLSCLYSTSLISICDYGKTIALTRQTFVDKLMSLLFNMLSRLVILSF